MKHPATYSNQFLPIFYEEVKHCKIVLDPFAGTGKIAEIKVLGFTGQITCNDLEPEYKSLCEYPVDKWLHLDAAVIDVQCDAIVTSPTYGNRMADHHNAKDGSKRMTYTHQLGRKLSEENTGAMQWGDRYKQKHIECYTNFYKILIDGGLFVINISDHIRKGQVVKVAQWTMLELLKIGFDLIKIHTIPVSRLRYGANHKARVEHEYIYVFKK